MNSGVAAFCGHTNFVRKVTFNFVYLLIEQAICQAISRPPNPGLNTNTIL